MVRRGLSTCPESEYIEKICFLLSSLLALPQRLFEVSLLDAAHTALTLLILVSEDIL